jgi:hypothetical protein
LIVLIIIWLRDAAFVQSLKLLVFVGDNKDLVKLVLSEAEFGKLGIFEK